MPKKTTKPKQVKLPASTHAKFRKACQHTSKRGADGTTRG